MFETQIRFETLEVFFYSPPRLVKVFYDTPVQITRRQTNIFISFYDILNQRDWYALDLCVAISLGAVKELFYPSKRVFFQTKDEIHLVAV